MSSIVKTYCKDVYLRELDIYKLASENGIAPTIINYEQIQHTSKYRLITEKYTSTLLGCTDKKLIMSLKDKAQKCIKDLHGIGFFHFDISETNIVIDEVKKDVKLIDFELSRHIHSIKQDELSHIFDDYAVGNQYKASCEHDMNGTLQMLQECEIEEIGYLFDIYSDDNDY